MRKLLMVAAVLGLTGVGMGEDWPKFMGPRGDGISQEKINDAWPKEGPKVLWKAKVGAGYSSPLVKAGRVYYFGMVDNKDTLSALDAKTGDVVWQEGSEPGWPKDGTGFPGTRATPAIDGDNIYTYSGNGELICRKLADGKPVWTTNVLKETGGSPLQWGQSSTPLVAGDLVYVQGGGGGAVAVAVNKTTGAYAWKGEKSLGGYAAPIIVTAEGKELLIVVGGKQIMGLDPKTGQSLWNQRWETSYDVNAATPLYRDGQLLVSSGYGHGCIALKISAAGAQKLWANSSLQAKAPSPILEGDVVYGNSEGTLVALNWKTGAKLWRGEDKVGAGGSLLKVGDKLLVVSEGGDVLLCKPGEKELTTLVTFKAVKGKSWVPPVISGGRLLVKGETELVCYDVAGK